MTETSQSVPIGSERLKKDIVTGNFQFLDFSNREELIRQLGFYAWDDILSADVPYFDGSIRFMNDEYIALVEELEGKRIEEKRKILQQVIRAKTREQASDLKISLDAEKTKIKEALSDLAPEKITSSAQTVEKLIGFVDNPSYKMILRSYAGALMLETLEKHNERIVVNADKTIKIEYINIPASQNQDLDANKNDLERSLNDTLSKTPTLLDTIQSGMLFRALVETSDKKTPDKKTIPVDMTTFSKEKRDEYFKELQAKKDKKEPLTTQEQTLLLSQAGFANFESSINPQDVAKLMKAVESTGEKGAASAVGEGIGQIGGTIGKLAAAGAGGGIKVLGDILASATKEWGAWGALAVVGGLIAAIWKGGFWKTLGVIFGVGVLSEASAGRLDLDFGKKSESKTDKPQKSDTPTKWTEASSEAENIPSTDTNYMGFLTTNTGIPPDKVQESKNILSQFDNVKYSEAEAFITEGKISQNIDILLWDKTKSEYEQKKEVLKKYIIALTKKDTKGGGFSNIMESIKKEHGYTHWTMKQVREYIFNIKERAAETADRAEQLAKNATTPEDATAARQLGVDARTAAENGDVEWVHWYSGVTSWFGDNIANIALYGGLAYWLATIKGGTDAWRTTNWFVWLRGKTAELIKRWAGSVVSKWKWKTPDGATSPVASEASVQKKALKINYSILWIESLSAQEKWILISVIERTEKLSVLEDSLLNAGKTEKFRILREKITLGKEIQELLLKNPDIIGKLKVAGIEWNKMAGEFAIFAEKISKIEISTLITKILKILKRV